VRTDGATPEQLNQAVVVVMALRGWPRNRRLAQHAASHDHAWVMCERLSMIRIESCCSARDERAAPQ
jgi:hypothetical protein